MVAILNFQSFCKTQKRLYLENRAIWSELNKNLDLLGISNFQNIFVSPNIADILNFFIFLKTVLDRADCADFGCHNSIRLETKHFLNTLALTFISFSGRFVFAMQKHYLFFLRAIL